MSIQPEGENIRRAVKWISEQRKYEADKPVRELIETACLKFDLTPRDAEYLFQVITRDNV